MINLNDYAALIPSLLRTSTHSAKLWICERVLRRTPVTKSVVVLKICLTVSVSAPSAFDSR